MPCVISLLVAVLALAVMIGDGCCAFVSIALGAGGQENIHQSNESAVLLCVIDSLVLTALYLFSQDPILTMFGGSPKFAMASTLAGAVVNIILGPFLSLSSGVA